MRIFLDTSGLIALSDEKDRNHKKAEEYLRIQVQRGARFVSGRNILVEYIDATCSYISPIIGTKQYNIHRY